MSSRLMICEETATGASPSSMVISMVISARCRWVKETMREVETFTCLPAGVRHTSSRRSTPSRKSIHRSYSTTSAIDSSSGSSSTYRFINDGPCTEIMGLQVRATPHQLAVLHALAEVDPPLVLDHVRDRQQQRLVVDVQLHHRGVGHRDHGLPGPGKPESGLGVVDGPGLVKAVEEGAVVLGIAPLLGDAAHPQEAVGGDEQGLHQAQIAIGAGLDQAPLVDRQVEAVDRIGGHRAQAAHVISSRSATTSVA